MSYAEIHAKFFPRTRPVVKAVLPAEPVESVPKPVIDWKRQSREFEEARRRETGMVAAIEAALANPDPAPLTMLEIAEEVARKNGLDSWRDLQKRTRRGIIVFPRQEAMWRCYKETYHSFPTIGRFFGGFDHTTVMHAVKAHEKRMGGT